MSVRVMTMVWKAAIHPPARKLVALKLADHCNDEGGSLKVSYGHVAQQCSLSRDQARRYMRSFVDDGLLIVISSATQPGTTPRYRVDLARLAGMELVDADDATESEGEPEKPAPVVGAGMVTGGIHAPPTSSTHAPRGDSTHATPPGASTPPLQSSLIEPTGGMGAVDQGHGCTPPGAPTPSTGGMGATLTTNNHQGTIKEPEEIASNKKKPKRDLLKVPDDVVGMLADVDAQHLADWLRIRKDKKAGALTVSTVKGLAREAKKAGMTVPQAIEFCCSVEWRGFFAAWYAERIAKQPAGQTGRKPTTDRHRGFDQIDYTEGVKNGVIPA